MPRSATSLQSLFAGAAPEGGSPQAVMAIAKEAMLMQCTAGHREQEREETWSQADLGHTYPDTCLISSAANDEAP